MLREFLDIFFTAYIDDILIYINGSRKDHIAKVWRVLRTFADIGLHLDPGKCEFGIKTMKYLRFIITVGERISCDLEKIRTISE